ncbi:MAG: hypothetical protein ACXVCT_20225 [Ktedonobacterales bacterium]
MRSGRRLVAHRPALRAPHRRRFPWFIAFCLIGLLAVTAPSPQLRVSALAGQGMQFASSGFYGAARLVAKVPDTISLLVEPHAPHQYWQVGVTADTSSVHARAIRTRIITRLPQRVDDTTTNYFWIGSYLSDGSFIQIGYWVPWYDSAHAGWFYCAFDAGAHKGPCIYGAMGTAGSDGTPHTYSLEASADGASGNSGAATWRAEVDGQNVGAFRWTAGETGTNAPAIYAESSGFAPHASNSQLGPVDFIGGVETCPVGRQAYVPAAHMLAAYSAANVCPPYGIASDGHGGALLGSGLACPDRYSEI